MQKALLNQKIYKDNEFFDLDQKKILISVLKDKLGISYAKLGKELNLSWFPVYKSCEIANKNLGKYFRASFKGGQMNHKNGFVLLHRKIFNSADFKNQLDVSVFIYLMAMASHEPVEVIYRCKKILLQRGEVCIAERDLAKKFDITKSKVKSIIKRLINNHNLYQRTTKRLSVYSIVKYNKYQSLDKQNDHKTTKKSSTEQSNKLIKSNASIGKKYDNKFSMTKIDIKSSKPSLKNLKDIIYENKSMSEFEIAKKRLSKDRFEQFVRLKLQSNSKS